MTDRSGDARAARPASARCRRSVSSGATSCPCACGLVRHAHADAKGTVRYIARRVNLPRLEEHGSLSGLWVPFSVELVPQGRPTGSR